MGVFCDDRDYPSGSSGIIWISQVEAEDIDKLWSCVDGSVVKNREKRAVNLSESQIEPRRRIGAGSQVLLS